MSEIGLDFGTTNSCVARSDPFGGVTPVSVAPLNTRPYDSVLASSVLDPTGADPVLGYIAQEQYHQLDKKDREGRVYLSNFKLFLDDYQLKRRKLVVAKIVREYRPSILGDEERAIYREEFVGGPYTREELVGAVKALLDHMLESAEEESGDQLLLGIPVSFSSRARKRMVCALYETGRFPEYRDLLGRLRFVLEPIAAAAAGMREALDADEQETVLVFDHGGGTLDMSLLAFEARPEFEHLVPVKELNSTGRPDAAGREFDERLRSELSDVGEIRRALERLSRFEQIDRIRAVKEDLSVAEEAELNLGEVTYPVARSLLERAAAPILGNIEQEVLRLVEGAGLQPKDVTRVLMTGGSSLIPSVQDRVRTLFREQSEIGRVRAYDPTDEADVERAITEIAQGLAYMATDTDLERVVLWDVELLDSEGSEFTPVAVRGEPYDRDDGGPSLTKRVTVADKDRNGMALGLWEAQLDKHFFLFGIADVPPLEEPATLEITLRPEALYPQLRLLTSSGTVVARDDLTGWQADLQVAADVDLLPEGQLQDFFEEDEVDFLPVTPFKRFRHAPLTRLISPGDRIEWTDLSTERADGSLKRRAGEIIKIRRIGSHDPLDRIDSPALDEYEFTVRLDGGGTIAFQQPYGTMRVATSG